MECLLQCRAENMMARIIAVAVLGSDYVLKLEMVEFAKDLHVSCKIKRSQG